MEQETLKIFIGFDDKEAVVFHTCVQSIIEKSKVPVSIHPLNLQMFQNYKETHNDGSNNFIYSRFLVPYLNNFKGKALFLDGDMIVNDDVSKLFDHFKEEWTEQIPADRIKSKHIEGKHTFHYINDYAANWQGKMTPGEASVFFIYNEDQDIHYFYMK